MGKASRKKKTLTKAGSSTKAQIDLQTRSGIPAAFGFLYKPFFHIFLIITLTFLAYSNTFHSSFQFDDYDYIVNNLKLKNLSNFWPPAGSRWIGYLTFALNYRFGGLNVTGYHVVNITIHIINALLVYWLVMLTLQTPYFKCQSFRVSERQSVRASERQGLDTLILGHFDTKFVALFSALFFAVHPVQTQAVTYITQRFASLATMFYLLSIVMYVKFRIQDKESKNRVSCIVYLVSLISAVLAMKTKEIAFTLPIIIILYEFSFFTETFNLPIDRQASSKLLTLNFKKFLFLIPFFLTLVIIPLNFIGHEWEVSEPASDYEGNLRQLQLRDLAVLSKYEYLITQFRVIVTYIRLLFVPVNQNIDYDYPVYNSFFNPNVILSFLFLLSIFGLGVYLFYCSKNPPPSLPTGQAGPFDKGGIKGGCSLFTVHCSRLTAFGIFWFFITLSVESSIIPIKDVIFEHRVYLPSIGLFIATGTFFFMVIEGLRSKWKYAYIGLLMIIAVMLTGTAYARNAVWKERIILWEDAVSKSPMKARPHNNLGNAYQSQGFIDKAIEQFQTAIKLSPNYSASYYNLGLVYQLQGLTDKAIEQYEKTIKLNQKHLMAYYNLGNAYQSQGLTDRAIEQYEKAIKLKPNQQEPHVNLGNAYQSRGFTDKAIEQYEAAVKLNPEPRLYYTLGNAYAAKGLFDKAMENFQSAIELKPDFPEPHVNLGNAYLIKGMIDKAIEQYQIVIKLNPDIPDVYYNLGILYQSKNLTDKAIESYAYAIKLNPGWEMPHFDLGRIYFEKGNMENARMELEKVLRINPRNQKARKILDLINQNK